MVMTDFNDRNIIVTGGAGVLGAAVADRFAAGGAKVAILDIVAVDGPHLSIECDLMDADACHNAVARVRAELGDVTALANVAGGFVMGDRVHETTDETWDFMLDLNARTVLNMVRATVPAMIDAGGGAVVSVAARAGLEGAANMGAYSASKGLVIRLTESLASELREQGINVNCVLPSIIDTPRNRTDMPDADFATWVAPADLADVIAFLASDAARAVHGAAVPVVGLC
jgi:NAD(P)-dependent dehydrogenase (short-subunit alcohol dehydrogenase family)